MWQFAIQGGFILEHKGHRHIDVKASGANEFEDAKGGSPTGAQSRYKYTGVDHDLRFVHCWYYMQHQRSIKIFQDHECATIQGNTG